MKSLNLTKPHLIVVVGIPGAGKTFFARQFADTFNAPYLRSDDLLELTDDGSTAQKVWDFTLEKLTQTKQTLLVEGFGATAAERRDLSAFARKQGYQALYIWVQTEPSTALQRATKGNGRERPEYPITEREFKERAGSFEPLSAVEHYMVISGKHTYASQAKNVLKKLAEPRIEHTKLTPSKRTDAAPADTSHRGKITIN